MTRPELARLGHVSAVRAAGLGLVGADQPGGRGDGEQPGDHHHPDDQDAAVRPAATGEPRVFRVRRGVVLAADPDQLQQFAVLGDAGGRYRLQPDRAVRLVCCGLIRGVPVCGVLVCGELVRGMLIRHPGRSGVPGCGGFRGRGPGKSGLGGSGPGGLRGRRPGRCGLGGRGPGRSGLRRSRPGGGRPAGTRLAGRDGPGVGVGHADLGRDDRPGALLARGVRHRRARAGPCGADLDRGGLARAHLVGAHLVGARSSGAGVSGAGVSGAGLRGIGLGRALRSQADLRPAARAVAQDPADRGSAFRAESHRRSAHPDVHVDGGLLDG